MMTETEIVKNAATNGRLFCVMLFVVALVSYANGWGVHFGQIAVLAALPIGAAVVIDIMLRDPKVKAIAAAGLHIYTAILAIVLLASVG